MLELNLIDQKIDTAVAFTGTYDWPLVALSYLIAVVAAYAAFSFARWVSASDRRIVGYTWVGVGAATMGIGIWAMHFIGMLAFRLPVAVSYDPAITALSMIPGVFASAIALRVISRPSITAGRLSIGATLMGGGIAAMHYAGMEAMRTDAFMSYDLTLVAFSICVAIALSMLSLSIQFLPSKYFAIRRRSLRPGALVMGTAVTGMHYTAMAAANFFPSGEHGVGGTGISPALLGGVVGMASLLIMALAILAGFANYQWAAGKRLAAEITKRRDAEAAVRKAYEELERRIEARTAELHAANATLESSGERMRSVLDTASDGIITIDYHGLIESFNPGAERIFGYAADEVLGRNVKLLMREPERSAHDGHIARYLDTGETTVVGGRREVIGVCKSGQSVHLDLAVSELTIGGQRKFTGIVRDITERKQIENQLRRSEELLRSAIDNMLDGFVIFGSDNRLVLCNARYRMMHPNSMDLIFPGARLEEIVRGGAERGEFPDAIGRIDEWVAEHMDMHQNPNVMFEIRLIGDRWIRAYDRTMPNGMRVGIRVDITELKQAKEAAEEADRAKSAFLSAMSHELRTPLNAIIGYSEMLQDEAAELGLAPFESDLDKINLSGKHLLDLINDILDLSKIEAGKMEISPEVFRINDLVETTMSTVHTLMQKNANTLEIDCPDDIGEMYTDPTKLRQCLLNLLSNAAKFTKRGRIRLVVRREEVEGEPWMSMQVTDTGIGVSKEQIKKLFGTFTQAAGSAAGKYGGTGLGLAITRDLCRIMGGDVSVTSELGRGSTFTIRLPASFTALAVRKKHSPQTPDVREVAGASSGEHPLVLVIDDDPRAVELMRRQLTQARYRVVTARSGEAGLALARQQRPAAIALDVIMPGMDGWEVLEKIKTDPMLWNVPVVMCTIVDEPTKGFALGAADYLVKPIGRGTLVRTLSRYCTRPPCRILLAEDDLAMRGLLARMLARAGWTVTEAGNGREALERLAISQPHVIVLDLIMPGMDGFEFIEELRRHNQWRDVPVVVLTGKDLTDEDRSRLNRHVKACIEKGQHGGENALEAVSRQIAHCLMGSAPPVETE